MLIKALALATILVWASVGCESESNAAHSGDDDDNDNDNNDNDNDANDDDDNGDDDDDSTDADSDGDSDEDVEVHSYIWIANTADSTLSKVDTQAVQEVARYRTCPLQQCDPSRTSVNLHGDMVVTNRGSTPSSVTKFAADKEECIDKNSNGTIETSSGPNDVLPWGEDECMIWSTDFGSNVGARATAWDGQEDEDTGEGGHIWIGSCPAAGGSMGQATVYKLNGDTGEIMEQITLSSTCAYGGAIGPDGGFWIMSGYGAPNASDSLIRVDTESLQTNNYSVSCGYGISVDSTGRIWLGGMGPMMLANCVSRYDPIAGSEQPVQVQDATFLRGIAVGVEKSEGFVWAADTDGTLYKLSEDPPAVVASYTIGPGSPDGMIGMIGVAIDFEGYVWTVDQGANATYKFDPDSETFVQVTIGSGPYTYSDMTGVQLKNAVDPDPV